MSHDRISHLIRSYQTLSQIEARVGGRLAGSRNATGGWDGQSGAFISFFTYRSLQVSSSTQLSKSDVDTTSAPTSLTIVSQFASSHTQGRESRYVPDPQIAQAKRWANRPFERSPVVNSYDDVMNNLQKCKGISAKAPTTPGCRLSLVERIEARGHKFASFEMP